MRRLWSSLTVTTLLAGALTVTGPTGIAAADAGDTVFTLTGHGNGHGRGMGQYGAYGYAVDQGWSYTQILDHYYGGTTMGPANQNTPVTVRLTAQSAVDLRVQGSNLTVGGAPVAAGAVRIQRLGVNSFQTATATSCAGPWTLSGDPQPGPVTVSKPGQNPANPETLPIVCQPTRNVWYLGDLAAVEGPAQIETVLTTPLDQYVRGVVPRESPASWGNAGGGRGMEALKAQAVAARSYAMADRRSVSQTCDSESCQVFGGLYVQYADTPRTALTAANTDTAVAATAGQVRRFGGADGPIARAEFSSSTGGWTAGGAFPAVQDAGDATSINPHHDWTRQLTSADVAAGLALPSAVDMSVMERNGLGADGGRALTVQVRTADGVRTFTGDRVRIALGLRSNWFTVSSDFQGKRDARAAIKLMYSSLLARQADSAGLSAFVAAWAGGTPLAAIAQRIAESNERRGLLVRDIYLGVLNRRPDPVGLTNGLGVLQQSRSYVTLASFVLASGEAFDRVGRNPDRWVQLAYQFALGRSGSTLERQIWVDRVRVDGRAAVARSLLVSAEAAGRRLDRLYLDMLGRHVDPAGARVFRPSMNTDGLFTVPVSLGASREFVLRGRMLYP